MAKSELSSYPALYSSGMARGRLDGMPKKTLASHLTRKQAIEKASDAAAAAFALQHTLDEGTWSKREESRINEMITSLMDASFVYANIAAGRVIDREVASAEDYWDDADNPEAVRAFVKKCALRPA